MNEIKYLKEKAKEIRRDVFNLAVEYKDGHIAPALSCVEILVAIYEKITEYDKFIMSKGHGCLGLYAVLKSKGFNPKITGHPDIEREQGIECTTGSLGHGLPIGIGMAFAKKFKKKKGQVFVLIGDGECQEGTIWESLNLIRKFKLINITTIVDHNKLQALDSIKNIIDESDLKAKFEAFGVNVVEINGHDFNELFDSLNPENNTTNAPRIIIAHTIKGKGVSFMENTPCWHARLPDDKLLEQAYKELQ